MTIRSKYNRIFLKLSLISLSVSSIGFSSEIDAMGIFNNHQPIKNKFPVLTINALNEKTRNSFDGNQWQTVDEGMVTTDNYFDNESGQIVNGGTTSENTFNNKSWQNINLGEAKDNDFTNYSGQSIKGGIASNNSFSTGSIQNVDGGKVTDNKFFADENEAKDERATQTINNGGVAEKNSFDGGAWQNVNGGAKATNNIFTNKSGQSINNPVDINNKILQGEANDNKFFSGSAQDITNGLAVNNEFESSTQTVNTGGIANNNKFNNNSWQNVNGGETNINVINNNGGQNITKNGRANNNKIMNGSWQNVLGGVAYDNIIAQNSGQNVSSGNAEKTTVEESSWQDVHGGLASNNIIKSGAVQNILGGAAKGNEIAGQQNIQSGIASDNNILGFAKQIINGGMAEKTIVQAQAIQEVNIGTIKDTAIYGKSNFSSGAFSQGYFDIKGGGEVAIFTNQTDIKTIENLTLESEAKGFILHNPNVQDVSFIGIGKLSNSGLLNINQDFSIDFSQYITVSADSFFGNGTILMHSDIANQTGDLLKINYLDKSARQGLDIRNNGAANATDNDTLTVVMTDSGGIENQFYLTHSVESGGYQFALRQANDNKDWELYSPKNTGPGTTPDNKPLFTSTADAAANSIISTYLASFVDTQTLLQRMGELQQSPEKYGVWARIYGGKLNTFAGQGLEGFDMKYYTLQIGIDNKLRFDNSRLYLGVATSYMYAKQEFDKNPNYLNKNNIGLYGSKGSGNLRNYNAYGYATYITDDNFYIDALFKIGHMKSKFNVNDSANMISKGEMSLNLFSLSTEIGQQFYFNDEQRGLYITPQAQFTYTRFGSGTFHSTNGLNVKVNHRESQLGRLGAAIGYKLDSDDSDNTANVYYRVSYLKEFSNDGQFYLNNNQEVYSMKGHWWQHEIGMTKQLNKSSNIYLNLNYNEGQHFDQKQIELGYRYEF